MVILHIGLDYECKLLHGTADRLSCFDRQLCVGVWFVEMGPSLLVDCQSRSHFECLYIFDMAQIHAVGMSTMGSKLRVDCFVLVQGD